ncbi:MAG: hypothetical protein EI684_14505 [Candidatus Viridilinea halotolerans]|uniref:Uncharacterized protein n=1 Tax=Candidatus Viridilinea halotolerans TaxID=2491704 RepID=A0A426TWE7_9CHLR|nr:MAG: hypothetical protein EI684_14505 [Candidatus Viridilinea halotolerans]
MARRGKKQRKHFACGHIGYGQYCHTCAQAHKEAEAKRQWDALFLHDPIDLRCLPHSSFVKKARHILEAIEKGADYRTFDGKFLKETGRKFLSIPLGRDWRILFRLSDASHGNVSTLIPVRCCSHETYNNFISKLR